MAESRDFSGESWRLKIERAKHHFLEFQEAARLYAERHQYEIRWERETDPKTGRKQWVARLWITDEPPAELALIIGDAAHNARTALDHLAVKIAGRSGAGLPISTVDVLAKDVSGNFLSCDEKRREHFVQAISGMPAAAVAAIQALQPYAPFPPALRCEWLIGDKGICQDTEAHYLRLLSRMDNGDKHKKLTVLAGGMTSALRLLRTPAGLKINMASALFKHGTPVAFSAALKPETEVQVDIQGAVQVLVQFKGPKVYVAPAAELLDAFTTTVPEVVFAALEPFVP